MPPGCCLHAGFTVPGSSRINGNPRLSLRFGGVGGTGGNSNLFGQVRLVQLGYRDDDRFHCRLILPGRKEISLFFLLLYPLFQLLIAQIPPPFLQTHLLKKPLTVSIFP